MGISTHACAPASLRAPVRDHPVYIAEQLGYTDSSFTFRVYQRAAKRRERLAGAYLETYGRALHWAEMGRMAVETPREADREFGAEVQESAL